MFVFIHLILGLLIGLQFQSITLIIILALFSHFLLDYLPHWDGWFDKEYFERTGFVHITKKDIAVTSFDFILTILSIFIFWHYAFLTHLGYSKMNVALGAFMSVFPDLLKIGYLTDLKRMNVYNRYLKLHSKLQKKSDNTNWKIGFIIQAMFLIAFLLMMIYIMFL